MVEIMLMVLLLTSLLWAIDHVPADVLKQIVCYVADQHDCETAYSNIQSLMRLMRVNKKFYALSKGEYKRLLAEQTDLVNKEYENDFERYNTSKNICTYRDDACTIVNYTYQKSERDIQSKKIACAIQRPCLVWLCHALSTYPANAHIPIYHNYLRDHPDNRILPITWAVYMNSEGAQQIISCFYENKTDCAYYTEQALHTKPLFDQLDNSRVGIKPYKNKYSVWRGIHLE